MKNVAPKARSFDNESPLTAAIRLRATGADAGREVVANGIGNQELRVLGPSVVAFGEADCLLAQRLAMSCGGILLMRRAVADVAIQNDEGWALPGLAKDVQG